MNKRVCVGPMLYMCGYKCKCIQYGVCVLVLALVGRSAMMNDELAQRGHLV